MPPTLTVAGNRHRLGSTGAPVVSRPAAGRRGFVSPPAVRILIASLLLALTAACAAPPNLASPSASSAPTGTDASTRTPGRTPTFTRTPSPTPPGCLAAPGEIRTGELDDPALSRPLPYRVFLPGCYDEQPGSRFPTLYLLHGLQATDAQWDDLGVDEAAARLIAAGEIPPLIIVMPWERRGLEYEPAIADVLVPWIDRSFRTLPTPAARAIGGLSRGAGWALRIALLHRQLFTAVGLHSPAVLSPDLFNIPFWLEGLSPEESPRFWIDIGDRDPLRPPTLELLAIFDQVGISYDWHPYPGYHAPDYWSSHLEEYLVWYSLGWD